MTTDKPCTTRVLLIGWEPAEWNILAPLVESGKLPHLSRLIDRGVTGRLAAFDVPELAVAWTSLATGKRPHDHGILGPEEPAENGVDVRPFSPASRCCKAIWNILSDSNLNCHVIGWPATYPAEKLNGVMLSSGWDETRPERHFDSRAVWPAEFAETAGELRMDAGELNIHDLRSFIPAIIAAEPVTDPRIFRLARAIAIAASRQAAATYLMENEPWDFLAVHFSSLADITRDFVEFHPPRLSHLSEENFDQFRGVVTEAYRFHDQMLGRLVELAGPETTIILCSTCGVHTGESRAVADPTKAQSYAEQYHPRGTLFMAGPTVQKNKLAYGATVYDIAPTVLALLGRTVARDLAGRVLAEAFSESPSVASIDSWENKTAQLRVRGAAKPLPDGAPSPALFAAQTNDFNLARSLQACGRHDLALQLLESTQTDRPPRIGPTFHLIHCYRALGQTAKAIQALERLAAELAQNNADQSVAFLPQFDLMRGLLALDQGNAELALSHVRKAETATVQLPDFHVHLGQVYIRLRHYQNAEAAFRHALDTDSEHAEAAAGLSAALYRQRRYNEAADHALVATAHAPWLGQNHVQLGRCLARLGRHEDASFAIQTALRHQPALIEAHRLAVVLGGRTGADQARLDWHKGAIRTLLPLRTRAWEISKRLGSQTQD